MLENLKRTSMAGFLGLLPPLVIVALVVAPWTHEYFQLSDTAIPAVHFLFGLFGMSVAYQLNTRVSPIVDWVFERLGLNGGNHV